METKYTKGNWYVKFMNDTQIDDGEAEFWVKSDINPKVHYGTDIMSDDYGEHNGYPREQRFADAKLIAAAPDMLEALHELVSIENEEDPNKVFDAFYKAKQVINKAI